MNRGGRFSAKARNPSRRSSETRTVSYSSFSSAIPSASERWARAIARRAWRIPSGAPRAMAPASSSARVDGRPLVDDPRHDAPRLRLVRGQAAAGEDHVARPRRPDEPGEGLGAAAAREDADGHLRQAEHRRARRDDEVAREGELEAAGERVPLDRGDRRHRQLMHARDEPDELGALGAQPVVVERGPLLEVHARREGAAARAGDDDRPDRERIARDLRLDRVERAMERREQRVVDGVQRGGPVEREDDDLAALAGAGRAEAPARRSCHAGPVPLAGSGAMRSSRCS